MNEQHPFAPPKSEATPPPSHPKKATRTRPARYAELGLIAGLAFGIVATLLQLLSSPAGSSPPFAQSFGNVLATFLSTAIPASVMLWVLGWCIGWISERLPDMRPPVNLQNDLEEK